MADMSLRIDEIEGRPIFVIESTPNCGSSAHLVKSGRKQRITGTPPHRRAQGEEHRAATPAESVSAYCNLLLIGSITKCAEEPKIHYPSTPLPIHPRSHGKRNAAKHPPGRFRFQVQHFLEGRWLHEGEEVPTSGVCHEPCKRMLYSRWW